MPGGLVMIIKEKIFSLVGKKEMNSLLKNPITESLPQKQDSRRF